MKLDKLLEMWEQGRNVPVDEDDCIQGPWAGFPVGTPREEIWHWFEEQNPEFSVVKAQQNYYRNKQSQKRREGGNP